MEEAMFKVMKLVSLGLLAFAGLACAEEFADEQHDVHELMVKCSQAFVPIFEGVKRANPGLCQALEEIHRVGDCDQPNKLDLANAIFHLSEEYGKLVKDRDIYTRPIWDTRKRLGEAIAVYEGKRADLEKGRKRPQAPGSYEAHLEGELLDAYKQYKEEQDREIKQDLGDFIHDLLEEQRKPVPGVVDEYETSKLAVDRNLRALKKLDHSMARKGLNLERAMSRLKQQQVQFAELANLLKTFASADEIEDAYRNLGGGPEGADDVLPFGKDDATYVTKDLPRAVNRLLGGPEEDHASDGGPLTPKEESLTPEDLAELEKKLAQREGTSKK